jgi:hypothetical protein
MVFSATDRRIGAGIIGLSAKGGWAAAAHVPALRAAARLRRLQAAEPLDLPAEQRTWLSWLRETYGEASWSGAAKAAPLAEIADRMRSGGHTDLAVQCLLAAALRCPPFSRILAVPISSARQRRLYGRLTRRLASSMRPSTAFAHKAGSA